MECKINYYKVLVVVIMMCPKCTMVEMRVDKVQDNQMYFVCKKCGETKVVNIEDLESANQDE